MFHVWFQIQGFIQRKAMAQIEGLGDGKRGNEQLGAMMFAIKNICGSVDDLLAQSHKESFNAKSGVKSLVRQKSRSNHNDSNEQCLGLKNSEHDKTNVSRSLGNSINIMQAAIVAEERNRKLTESILERLKGY